MSEAVQIIDRDDVEIWERKKRGLIKYDVFTSSKQVDDFRSLGFFRAQTGRIAVNVYESGFMGKKIEQVFVEPEAALAFAEQLAKAARKALKERSKWEE